jgi:Ca2+-transporting ATPase
MSCRGSDRISAFNHPFNNRWLNLAILWEVILSILIVYLPFLQKPFHTFNLSLIERCIVVAAALTVSPVLETAEWFERRG